MRTGGQQGSRPVPPHQHRKSYFKLSRSARAVLDTALQKYRPGRTDLIPVDGIDQLKPALRLMTAYRLIQEVTAAEVFTSYTRWLECVQLKEDTKEVYVTFSPRFERISRAASFAFRSSIGKPRRSLPLSCSKSKA
jgi:hypothetical protein